MGFNQIAFYDLKYGSPVGQVDVSFTKESYDCGWKISQISKFTNEAVLVSSVNDYCIIKLDGLEKARINTSDSREDFWKKTVNRLSNENMVLLVRFFFKY